MKFYDQLTQFALFQGLSHTELLQMTGQTRFGFMRMDPQKTLVRAGDSCRQLYFMISGELTLTRWSDDHAYCVVEQAHAPWQLQIETLFGTHPQYTHTAVTTTECHFITISKDEVLRLTNDFLTFRLNVLNLLSALAQRKSHKPWRQVAKNLRSRIIRFMVDRCAYPAGPKEFHLLMLRLAQEVGDSRLDVSRELNKMQAEGLLELHRGRIVIPSLERMLM